VKAWVVAKEMVLAMALTVVARGLPSVREKEIVRVNQHVKDQRTVPGPLHAGHFDLVTIRPPSYSGLLK
jgi:hypothetical protein